MCVMLDFVYIEHRAQRTEEFIEPSTWHYPFRFTCGSNNSGTYGEHHNRILLISRITPKGARTPHTTTRRPTCARNLPNIYVALAIGL